MKIQKSLILLVLSNVLVGLSVVIQGFKWPITFDLASIGIIIAIVGIALAIWQGFQANNEQKREIKGQIKEADIKKALGMQHVAAVVWTILILHGVILQVVKKVRR